VSRLVLALATLAACGDGDASLEPPGSPDAGRPMAVADGGTALPPVNEALFAGTRSGIAPAGEYETDSAAEAYDPRTCWDDIDVDGDGQVDCDDSGCATVRACAIGDGDRCEQTSHESIGFDSCIGLPDARSCLGAARAIGRTMIEPGAMVPVGELDADAGYVFGDPLDLASERVRITVSFVRSECTGCVEGAAVAIAHSEVQRVVAPLVALVASSDRGNVSLVVGGATLHSWPIAADTPTGFELVLRPTGEVTARPLAGSDPPVALQIAPMRDLEIVAYGRNPAHATATDTRAGISDLDITRSLCDMPASWSPATAHEVRQGGARVEDFESPSIWIDGTTEAIAVSRGMAIFVGERAGGAFDLKPDPAVSQHGPNSAAGVTDPELFRQEGQWFMAFTGIAVEGRRSIGIARGGGTLDEPFLPDPTAGIDPAIADAILLEMPTVAVLPDGTWVLVARATAYDGTRTLLGFASNSDGASWVPYLGADLGASTARPGTDVAPLAFDADEIAHPTLVVSNGAYQLYFAGRRGTRWGVGLLASDEFLYWRPIDESSVLTPSVGMRAPDVFVSGTELLLTSANARTRTIETASRPIPARPL
jgi:hypothetical protein